MNQLIVAILTFFLLAQQECWGKRRRTTDNVGSDGKSSGIKYGSSIKINDITEGSVAFELAQSLTRESRMKDAADAYWKSILLFQPDSGYALENAYRKFMQTFADRGIPEQGPLYVAKAYLERKDVISGVKYLHESMKTKENAEALMLLAEHDTESSGSGNSKAERLVKAFQLESDDPTIDVRLGHAFFVLKELKIALMCFERAFEKSPSNVEAFANAVYLRSNICAWGSNGTQFQSDMNRLDLIIRHEMSTSMLRVDSVTQQSVVHPHMTLAYTLHPELKLAIAKSHSRAEMVLVKNAGITPYNHKVRMREYLEEFEDSNARIKIGYVSCSLKSKALVYLTQDLMGLHDRSKFEVHAYATTPPDDPIFLEKAMRGVDWRKKIQNSVEYFHETAGMDVYQLSKLIHGHGIHILIDWDGFSHNGIRPTGLFPIQAAPIQVVHQEYIGTMGAPYFQYQVSDITASPPDMWEYHSEKFIIMPNTFFVNSFAYQMPDLEPPPERLSLKRQPTNNGCGGPPASFVYCNFNKHLKFDSETFRGWLQILQSVKGSVLCLLEFPPESKENLVAFVKEVDKKLVSQVRFQPFVNNPYDNQRRVIDMCGAILDTPIYNGHTTSMESLYGGVPLITRGDKRDMSSLVGTSALKTLGIYELIANSTEEYQQVSVKIALDRDFFEDIRSRLVQSTTCGESPINPLWDLQRYVRNLENGFQKIWTNWMNDRKVETIFVDDVGPRENADGNFECPSSGSASKVSKRGKGKKKRKKKQRKQRRKKQKRQREIVGVDEL